ncbi:hypothetical protein ACFLXY_02075 [Chloroflexota bacterium]
MISKKILVFIEEIKTLEKTRAEDLFNRLVDSKVILDFRERFIVRGFLMPLYSFGTPSFTTRIGSFGKYILPDTYYGRQLSRKDRSRIINENLVFWRYLIEGQEILCVDENSASFMKIEGQPAIPVWRMINDITKQLDFLGEMGGGVFLDPDHLDIEKMMTTVGNVDQQEDEKGWLEDYAIRGNPKWVSLFWKYQGLLLDNGFEIRPAWFHILNYALYDIPIQRIPVFSALYSLEGKIDTIKFLDERLSQQARSLLSESLNRTTLQFHKRVGSESEKKKRSDMIFWLWHNVGHPDVKKTISYANIGALQDIPARTIQSRVHRIDGRLKKLNYQLIWELLGIGREIGLSPDMVYQVMVQKRYAPEGSIDDFSTIEEIERAMKGFNLS